MIKYVGPIDDDSDYYYKPEQDEGFIVERVHCQTGMCYSRIKDVGNVDISEYDEYLDDLVEPLPEEF